MEGSAGSTGWRPRGPPRRRWFRGEIERATDSRGRDQRCAVGSPVRCSRLALSASSSWFMHEESGSVEHWFGRRVLRRMRPSSRLWMVSVLSVLALAATSANVAHAQSDPATDWANYEKLTLASGLAGEPIDMAVLPDGRVLHTQRAGALRLTTPASGVTEVVNQFNVYTAGEQGLLTVALDPDFATNQWVYVYYAPRLDTPGGNAPGTLPAGQTEAYWDQWKGYDVLSRFKWTGNSLDMASEQQIIKIETNRGGSAHHAGDIAWDAQGNLFLSVGDNTSAQAGNAQGYAPINDSPGLNPAFDARRGAGNTNDLRGKILRIKVAADGSYTVPPGNLFPAGPKTRPEIYIMGLRNPYRMNIDKATNTLVWGEYAPDAGRDDARRGPMGLVEWNASPASGAPHNQGWP